MKIILPTTKTTKQLAAALLRQIKRQRIRRKIYNIFSSFYFVQLYHITVAQHTDCCYYYFHGIQHNIRLLPPFLPDSD